jgi:hypothetical protein
MRILGQLTCIGAVGALFDCAPGHQVATDDDFSRPTTLQVPVLAATEGNPSAPFGTINDMDDESDEKVAVVLRLESVEG